MFKLYVKLWMSVSSICKVFYYRIKDLEMIPTYNQKTNWCLESVIKLKQSLKKKKYIYIYIYN